MQGATGVFGSAILEVALGLIFLYFLLSSIASSVIELFATALKWRAKNLEWALGNLINDPALLRQVINHPLIRSMGQNASAERGQQRKAPDDPLDKPPLEGKPSYIPSRTFALAVMHALANPSTDVATIPTAIDGTIDVSRIRDTAQALSEFAAAATDPKGKQLEQAKQLTGQTVQALLEECRDPEAAARALGTLKQRLDDGLKTSSVPNLDRLRLSLAAATNLDVVRNSIAQLPDQEKAWATAIVDGAQHEIELATYKLDEFRTSVEAWFDHAMDRAAGVYKRDALKFLAIVAIVVTLASGADSVNFVTRLYVDSALRTQISQQASQSAQAPDISKSVQSLEPFATLFGYGDFPSAEPSRVPLWLLLKVAGELITIFAILLGAPFWFELLGKLVNVRGTGPKPASTAAANRAASQQGSS